MFKDSYFQKQLSSLLWLGFALTLGLVIFLPFYWLTESTRQATAAENIVARDQEETADLYATHCLRCHGGRGQGVQGGAVHGVSLDYDGFAEGHSEETLRDIITFGRPGTIMPHWGQAEGGALTSQQIDSMITFLRFDDPSKWEQVAAIVQTPEPMATPAAGPSEQDMSIARGAELFMAQCTSCHGTIGQGGLGPTLNQEYHFRWHSEELLWETIAWGRQNAGMPAFSEGVEEGLLTDQQIDDLVAFIISGDWDRIVLRPVLAPSTSLDDTAAALVLMEKYACQFCHLISGAPEPPSPVGPDISDIGARADADYIRESIVDPNAVVAESCPDGPCLDPSTMPPVGSQMSEEELELMVNYLSTLTGE